MPFLTINSSLNTRSTELHFYNRSHLLSTANSLPSLGILFFLVQNCTNCTKFTIKVLCVSVFVKYANGDPYDHSLWEEVRYFMKPLKSFCTDENSFLQISVAWNSAKRWIREVLFPKWFINAFIIICQENSTQSRLNIDRA